MATALCITLQPVTSSRIAELGYDEETFTLAVRFPPTKTAPAGKVYHYGRVSEELYDDLKNAESVGKVFNERIVKNPLDHPYVCVDQGIISATSASADAPTAEPPIAPSSQAEILPPDMPDDEDGLKSRAISTRTEVTAFTISTAEECERAMHEVLRIRAERKAAIAKVNAIKEPATAAWKAACALFNEIDSRYAEAEKYLDGAILAYREAERKRVAQAEALARQQQEAERAAAARHQQDELHRLQAEAQEEAKQRAEELALSDAAAAEAAGAPEEVVQAILENPLPVAARHVTAPPTAPIVSAAPIVQQNIPKVQGMSFATEWSYEIVNESEIPFTHEYYSLDPKKINAKVQALKKHANIPGVIVDSREVPIKRVGKRA